jgi:hypothetical protein
MVESVLQFRPDIISPVQVVYQKKVKRFVHSLITQILEFGKKTACHIQSYIPFLRHLNFFLLKSPLQKNAYDLVANSSFINYFFGVVPDTVIADRSIPPYGPRGISISRSNLLSRMRLALPQCALH